MFFLFFSWNQIYLSGPGGGNSLVHMRQQPQQAAFLQKQLYSYNDCYASAKPYVSF